MTLEDVLYKLEGLSQITHCMATACEDSQQAHGLFIINDVLAILAEEVGKMVSIE